MGKHKKKPSPPEEGTLIYPDYTRPLDDSGHGQTWDTPPGTFWGFPDDGSMWLKLELKYLAKPTHKDVEHWLQQVLKFEIGDKLAKKALQLMKGSPRIEFEDFIKDVISYLKKSRTPRKTKK